MNSWASICARAPACFRKRPSQIASNHRKYLYMHNIWVCIKREMRSIYGKNEEKKNWYIHHFNCFMGYSKMENNGLFGECDRERERERSKWREPFCGCYLDIKELRQLSNRDSVRWLRFSHRHAASPNEWKCSNLRLFHIPRDYSARTDISVLVLIVIGAVVAVKSSHSIPIMLFY